jgi:hypothetical protein
LTADRDPVKDSIPRKRVYKFSLYNRCVKHNFAPLILKTPTKIAVDNVRLAIELKNPGCVIR